MKKTDRLIDILVVSKKKAIAKKLVNLFERNDLLSSVAADLTLATTILEKVTPKIILYDSSVAGHECSEFIQKVKKDKRLNRIPIILLTSLLVFDELINGLECGTETFLDQGGDEEQLIGKIRSLLNQSGEKTDADKGPDLSCSSIQLFRLLQVISEKVTKQHNEIEAFKRHCLAIEKQVKDKQDKLKDANKRLLLAKKEVEFRKIEVESANKSKCDFLANMSHELRTPLNVVMGFSEFMINGMAGPMSDIQSEYIEDIWESGKQLLFVINDILDFSSLELGKSELELVEFNIKEAIQFVMDMFKDKAKKHQIDIKTKIEKGLDLIIADERKTKQVIFNLVSNAMNFTPDGGSIMLKARRVNKEEIGNKKTQCGEQSSEMTLMQSDFIEVSIEDTGIGITPADQRKLFKPFQHFDTSLSNRYPGSGFGLSLCKKILWLHGGSIWAESKEGQGSKFTFVIPLMKKEMKQDE